MAQLLLEHVSFNSARARCVNFALILTGLALWPTSGLDLVPVRSLWVTVFRWEPYSTGMMRALSRLLHGDVGGAYEFNPLAFPTLALMVVLLVTNAAAWRRARAPGPQR